MTDVRRSGWTWRSLVAIGVSVLLLLASATSYIINFDHIEHWSQLFAVATLASVAVFSVMGWTPLRQRARR
ncbi:hypothetical protein [Nocardia heshunensis]